MMELFIYKNIGRMGDQVVVHFCHWSNLESVGTRQNLKTKNGCQFLDNRFAYRTIKNSFNYWFLK